MEDEEKNETENTEQPTGDESKETKVEVTPEQIAAEAATLREENIRLLNERTALKKEAEGATEYVRSMMQTLQQAAAASRARGETDNPAQTTLERLNENPEAVLDEHFKTRMGPLYNNYVSNQAGINREMFADRMSRDPEWRDDWKKYAPEVDKFLENVPREVLAQPGAYERAFKYVLAENIDDVIKSRKTRSISAQERSAFVEGPSGNAPKERKVEGLTDVEKQVAKGLGLSDAEYTEWSRKDQYGS